MDFKRKTIFLREKGLVLLGGKLFFYLLRFICLGPVNKMTTGESKGLFTCAHAISREWSLHESDQCPHKMRHEKDDLSALCPVRQRKQALINPRSIGTFILDFPGFTTVRNGFSV